MAGIFLSIVNMSISASYIVLAIVFLRLFFKKFPKWIFVLLWGVVAIRLVCPISIESVVSLIPGPTTIGKVPEAPRPYLESGISIVDDPVNTYLRSRYFEGITRPVGHFENVMGILSVVWMIGMLLLLVYTICSYYRIKKKVYTAVRLRDNIYQSENVESPFILGIISPKIYLPFNVNEKGMALVVAHENAHIRRKDHWWKPLGFLLLTIHWFNPLVWLAYIILCKDIELACDEKVIKEFDSDLRADYSETLLSLSVSRQIISACPIAFGEVAVKDRVKTVLSYKKPAFWIIILAVLVCIAVSVCFLTNPKDKYYGETSLGKLSDEQIALMEKCPQYFGLDATDGLDLYVWQMAKNSYSFGLLPHSPKGRELFDMDLLNMKGCNIEQIRIVLSTYDIDESDINIIPWQNPLSSYLGPYWIIREGEDINAKRSAYVNTIREMLWGDMKDCTVLYVCPIYSFIVDPATVPMVEIENGVAYKITGSEKERLGTVSEIELNDDNLYSSIGKYMSFDSSRLEEELRQNSKVSYEIHPDSKLENVDIFYIVEQDDGDLVVINGFYSNGEKTDQIGYIYRISQ